MLSSDHHGVARHSINRRTFLKVTAAGAAVGLASTLAAALPASAGAPRFKAIAFDAFPLLDPRPVFALAERLFPGRGAALSAAWKVRQFDYSWLRATGKNYADFWRVTEDALIFAARETGLSLSDAQREELMGAYLKLKVWPDVLPVLQRLTRAGVKLAFLSNFTPKMLEAAITGNDLGALVTAAISTDAAQTYKPDPRAYQLGVERLGLPREQILFAAFAGWDAAGAKWFGYPTYWVNRLNQSPEELSVAADGVGPDLNALESFVRS